MSILILSTPFDIHAVAVKWGLMQLGINATLWNWEKFPNQDIGVWSIASQRSMDLNWRIGESTMRPSFDAIWYRRPAKSKASNLCHPDDLQVIQNESDEFLNNCLPFLGNENVTWFNHPVAAKNADNKMFQLVAAKEVGFLIPDTIIGNSLAALKNFFEKHEGKVICKGFSPKVWHNLDGTKTIMRTSLLSREHLVSEYAISACPNIYQELIEKQYELRVTVLGDKVLAAAINSQKDGATVDWRSDIQHNSLDLKLALLPPRLEELCLLLCRKLDLRFGAIDLIVTKSNDYIFLEINESGQFLWMEKIDPNLLLLDAFCKMLASDSGEDFDREKKLQFKDWYDSSSYHDFSTNVKNFDVPTNDLGVRRTPIT